MILPASSPLVAMQIYSDVDLCRCTQSRKQRVLMKLYGNKIIRSLRQVGKLRSLARLRWP